MYTYSFTKQLYTYAFVLVALGFFFNLIATSILRFFCVLHPRPECKTKEDEEEKKTAEHDIIIKEKRNPFPLDNEWCDEKKRRGEE
jgi:hypothetical protein